MKRILVLLVVLFSIGFSEDLIESGNEAYDKGDYQKAAQLYQKACDSGEAGGCFGLGLLYQSGQGVRQDYQKAAQVINNTSLRAAPIGCCLFGNYYKNGQGVNQD